jgi:hydrogenase expression/formation protein HypE
MCYCNQLATKKQSLKHLPLGNQNMGKLAKDELQKLLSCLKKDARVIVPPLPGYDSGVHLLNGKYIVVSSDPCTGVPEKWFGYLLINYAASDVALFGAKPEFCTINLLGPPSTKPETFYKVMKQTCKAADALDIAIVRGHTGKYDNLSGLLGVCTVYGSVEPEKLITPGNVKPGDLILCTKPIGLETTINFSLTHKALAKTLFGADQQKKLTSQVNMQSCVQEALELAKTDTVHSMHDATEGGFIMALNELAEASNVGFKVEQEKVPIKKETLALQTYFKLSDKQVLSMSSTGTILAAIDKKAKQKVEAILSDNIFRASFIGVFTENKHRIIVNKGKEEPFPQVADDPYAQILSNKE